jgi:hypothetical protein
MTAAIGLGWRTIVFASFAAAAVLSAPTAGFPAPRPLVDQPIAFEENRGQAEAGVPFLARLGRFRVLLTADGAVFDLRAPESRPSTTTRLSSRTQTQSRAQTAADGGEVRMRLVGSHPQPTIEGLESRREGIRYITARREFDVPSYRRVRYADVYPGIDLIYYGAGERLEYDFVVAPGADASVIALEFDAADSVRLDAEGRLVITAGGRELRQRPPHVYQDVNGARRTVPARYRLHDDGRVRFEVDAYDRRHALVIDPIIDLGMGAEGIGDVISVDALGNSFIGGLLIPFDPQAAFDLSDAFVAKIAPSGTVLWTRVFSGAGTEYVNGIAVDAAGNVVVTGATNSPTFPVSLTAHQKTLDTSTGPCVIVNATPIACSDVFVVKLSTSGATIFSTFLGGADHDFGMGVATDAASNIYVTGGTSSVPFPLAGTPAQPTFGGGPSDAFVAKFSPTGTLLYSSYLGGSGDDSGVGVAASTTTGEVTVTGETFGTDNGGTMDNDFPTRAPIQPTYGGGTADAFVAVYSLAGSAPTGALRCSSYLGGDDHDFGAGVAVDAAGNRYLTGNTISSTGTVSTATPGTFDGYVARLNAGCFNGFTYRTTIGGTSDDFVNSIRVTAWGVVHVGGVTYSTDFASAPAEDGLVFVGAFAVPLAPGAAPPTAWKAFGTTSGSMLGIAVDGQDRVYLAGASSGALGMKLDPGTLPPFSPRDVIIDILNRNISESSGKIWVAILSNPLFHPARVDAATITFGATGTEVPAIHCEKIKDVNRDGIDDLECKFDLDDAGFEVGHTHGTLRGITVDRVPFSGRDAVRVVPRGNDKAWK